MGVWAQDLCIDSSWMSMNLSKESIQNHHNHFWANCILENGFTFAPIIHRTLTKWWTMIHASKLNGVITRIISKLGKMVRLAIQPLMLPWDSWSRRGGFITLEDIWLHVSSLEVIFGNIGNKVHKCLKNFCLMLIGLWTMPIGNGWVRVGFSISISEFTDQWHFIRNRISMGIILKSIAQNLQMFQRNIFMNHGPCQ